MNTAEYLQRQAPLPPGPRAAADLLELGALVVDRSTGRAGQVVSGTYYADDDGPSELADLGPVARAAVLWTARRRGCSLADARRSDGWGPPPPMWGDGAPDEARPVVLVAEPHRPPVWMPVAELERYGDWFRRRLSAELLGQLDLFGRSPLGFAAELGEPSGSSSAELGEG